MSSFESSTAAEKGVGRWRRMEVVVIELDSFKTRHASVQELSEVGLGQRTLGSIEASIASWGVLKRALWGVLKRAAPYPHGPPKCGKCGKCGNVLSLDSL